MAFELLAGSVEIRSLNSRDAIAFFLEVEMTASSHILGAVPICIRIDGRDVRLSLEEAKALQAGLGRAIAKVERFEHGVDGLIARAEGSSPGAEVTR